MHSRKKPQVFRTGLGMIVGCIVALTGCPAPTTMSPADSGTAVGQDSGMQQMQGSGTCPQIGACIQNGGDPQTCESTGTAAAQTAYSQLASCLSGICGSGGANICQDPTATVCTECASAATSQGGPCMNVFVTCAMNADAGPGVDAGPNPIDAGPNPVDAGPGDAGPNPVDAGPGDAGPNPVDAGQSTTTHTVGGTISGISALGKAVVLQNFGADNLSLTRDGSFSFPTAVLSGTPYSAAVLTQPPGGFCIVGQAQGLVSGANVTSISVTCGALGNFNVGGSITGLDALGNNFEGGNVDIYDNGDTFDDQNTFLDGNFTFFNTVQTGQPYDVTFAYGATWQGGVCWAINASGIVGFSDVTNVQIECGSGVPQYNVGGTIMGLSGTVQLSLNGGAALSETASGAFQFPNRLDDGTGFTVNVARQPSNQVCDVLYGSGSVADANVTGIIVACRTVSEFTIGGQVSGLSGTLALQDNGGDNLTVTQNGAFSFATTGPNGFAYDVTVFSYPTGQYCSITNASGTVASANVSNVMLSCATATNVTVGGTVTGLNFLKNEGGGSSITLLNNGANGDTVSADGAFSFSTSVEEGRPYAVTLQAQPSMGACSVAQGSGNAATANITDVAVTCASSNGFYQVGGTASGVTGPVTLDDEGDMITINGNGDYSFDELLPPGGVFDVTVVSAPAGQLCLVSQTSGTNVQGDVTVDVSCATAETLGGDISGLAGTVVLTNQGVDLSVTSSVSTFQFASDFQDGSTYTVTVKTQPVGQICTVTSGHGMFTGPVSDVSVACLPAFNVSGTISGQIGAVVLQDNGGDDLTVASNATTFTFATVVAETMPYAVTVKTAPTGQLCTVANGSGTIATSAPTGISVSCKNVYSVSGTLSWTPSNVGTVVLQNNGGDNLTLTSSATTFKFATALVSGNPYHVTVLTPPTGETCTVTNGGPANISANVTNVSVACVGYTVGGSVSGLNSGASVVLQDNAGTPLTVSSNAAYSFPGTLTPGSAWHVTFMTQPAGETCTLGANAQGSSIAANESVSVSCVGYTVGGMVTGLGPSTGGPSPSLVLNENTGGPTTTITVNGSFTFPGTLAPGSSYNVGVKTNPYNETCIVNGGSSASISANVTGISVVCSFVNDCIDEELDNAETSVDCGGGTCPTCPLGDACKVAGDCASGHCVALSCCTPLSIAIFGNPGSDGSANFVQWLTNEGTSVKRIQTTGSAPTITAATLAPYDVIVLDWLTRDYTTAEATVFSAWVSAGGGVVAMSGYDNNTTDDWHANSLLAPMQVAYSGPIFNGPITSFATHPITAGLTSVTFNGGYGIADLGGTASTRTPIAFHGSSNVGYAIQMGSGRAFIWGDEWIEFDSEWTTNPQIQQLWTQVYKWIAPTVKCELQAPADGGT